MDKTKKKSYTKDFKNACNDFIQMIDETDCTNLVYQSKEFVITVAKDK